MDFEDKDLAIPDSHPKLKVALLSSIFCEQKQKQKDNAKTQNVYI